MTITFRQAYKSILASYRTRKAGLEPDLRPWEFVVQMFCSAYLSWRWLGDSARFQFWRPQYWVWVAQYSSLTELGTRANIAAANCRPKSIAMPAEIINRAWIRLPFGLETGEQLAIEPGADKGGPPRTTRPNPASATRP